MVMPTTLTVKDIMTEDPVMVEGTEKVIAAIELMTKNDIGSVLVTEDGRPVGIVTERDIMRRVCPKNLCMKGITVGEIMTRPLIHIEADAGLGQAFSLMMFKDVRRLLVVEKKEAVGIITQKDLMRGMLDTFMSMASL